MKTIIIMLLFVLVSCDNQNSAISNPTESNSGVKQANVKVMTNPSTGMTVEQENITERIKRDNLVGSIKHLYVISSYSGQVLMYSTVKGKVTSSGKRLNPKTVLTANAGQYADIQGIKVTIGDETYRTSEVLQDDGTYGDSTEYLYWFDAQGRYHQHYLGNEILHISDQPISVKGVVINISNEVEGIEKK